VERIPHRKFVKIVEKSTQWNRSDWDDVELWRLQLHET
jgi:adenine specific DNA methylase Mod